jgi:cobalt-zinc-cadmium efflux system membrane fusion protein
MKKEEGKMKNKRFIVSGWVLILFLMFIRCDEKNSKEDVKEHYETLEKAKVIELSEDEIAEFEISIGTAQPGKLQIQITVPGEVVVPPDNLAHIHPRFPGMVKEVKKHIGDYVCEGEILAVIESNESLTEYQIKSLISGTIIEKHITRGEIVEADNNRHGFVVADLSQIWVYLNLYQKDLPFVKKGQNVFISAGLGQKKVSARINYISPVIDEKTRTAKARVILPNPKDVWKPGLFVNGTIVIDEFIADVTVPKTAIELIENKPCVFVESENSFEVRFITLGKKDRTFVEVLNGLERGENYVTKGGFTLKAELQKEMFGDDHGH